MDFNKLWKLVFIWSFFALIIFSIARVWSLVMFVLTYSLYGLVLYKYREHVRPLLRRLRLDNLFGFLMLLVFSTVLEETWVYLLGNQIAHPVLWVDLILVTGIWLAWFLTWYFYLSKKYKYTESEALFTAGFIGILYEYIGTKAFLVNPLGIILAAPLALMVYAIIFLLPMQLVDFSGKTQTKLKYLVGAGLPFILSYPIAILFFIILSMANLL